MEECRWGHWFCWEVGVGFGGGGCLAVTGGVFAWRLGGGIGVEGVLGIVSCSEKVRERRKDVQGP